MRKDTMKRRLTKVKVLTHYGKGKCACVKCGFSDIRALSIDHIKGDGGTHRKTIKGGGVFYLWLINNSFPEGFQTLCMNCQFVKRYTDNKLPLIKKSGTVGKRVRQWVAISDDKFTINSVRQGLDLTPQESINVKHVLFRMVRDGELYRIGNGYYRKQPFPIKVFG